VKALYYFKRAISLPPKVVLLKIFQKLQKIASDKRRYLLDKKFPTYVLNQSFADKTLNSFLKKGEIYPLEADKIFAFNQRILNHEFNLLGSGWVQVHSTSRKTISTPNTEESRRIRSLIEGPYVPIDWHIDFKSGYRWEENTWSKHIQYGTILGADVKVPWELARMQHLISLAWGYQETREPLYKLEFRNQILDFLAANPPRYGVNWSCTMDVGIRVANWLLSYDLFRSFGAKFDVGFESVFIRSIYEHGRHIFSHLEYDPFLRSNHYLANIAGLLFVTAYLPSNPEVQSWFDFSVKELISEVLTQFHPDGSNFEGSTSYHRLSSEMTGYATALIPDAQIPNAYWTRLEKMAEFIGSITKPDGSIVQFGDNDSGRFIKLLPITNNLDHRYLIGALHSLKSKKGLSAFIQSQLEDLVEIKKKDSYPDFGVYILRNTSLFLAVRCGHIGQKGNGGHAHNDQLSFELSLQGQSVIVDPGTYVYTPFPEARRHFRSTAMHNTLAIAGKEQNEDQGLFRLTDRAHARLIQFDKESFVGEHSGFGAVHRRTLQIDENQLEGIDECEEAGMKQIFFHFSPCWRGKILNNREAEFVYNGLQIKVITSQASFTLENGEYSAGYGEKEAAPVLILHTDSNRVTWKIISPF